MSGGSLRIKHRGDAFTVNMSDFSSFDDYESTTLTMVFPGKVTDADSNAKVDGNTANWSDVVSLGSARAEGKDVPDPTPTPNNDAQNQAQGGNEDSKPPLWPLWILLRPLQGTTALPPRKHSASSWCPRPAHPCLPAIP